QRLEQAGAVAFPAGLDAGLLERIPPAAERIQVAPDAGAAHVADQLARSAATHDTVVRLVGGGLLDARTHAEAALLEQAGVEIEVIPGVPVAAAGAALAGVPLRGAAPGARAVTVEWGTPGPRAFVIEAAVAELQAAARDLVARGCPATAPALLASRPGSPQQRTRAGPL